MSLTVKCKTGGTVTKFCLSVPIGDLELSCCSIGLHQLHIKRAEKFPDQRLPTWEEVYLTPQDDNNLDHEPIRQSLDYFRYYFAPEDCIAPKIPNICWRGICAPDSFSEKVMKALLNHVQPGGRVSYSELALMVGNSKAQRAVGTVMR